MALNYPEIEMLFDKHMPTYTCQAVVSDQGTTTLHFIHRETRDDIVIDGIPDGQLKSEASIQKLSLTLEQEFAALYMGSESTMSHHR